MHLCLPSRSSEDQVLAVAGMTSTGALFISHIASLHVSHLRLWSTGQRCMLSSCPLNSPTDPSSCRAIQRSTSGEYDRPRMFHPAHSITYSGIYCLLCVATLLDIMTPELIAGLPAFIVSCQTYEGGFCCASQPFFAPGTDGTPVLQDWPRPPLGEAHGGYSYCALASWALLRPFIASCQLVPTTVKTPTPSLDLKALLRWLANLQGSEVELGGFRGRTNKLVDGCYSWWVGAEFPLVEWLAGETLDRDPAVPESTLDNEADEPEWQDVEDGIFNKSMCSVFPGGWVLTLVRYRGITTVRASCRSGFNRRLARQAWQERRRIPHVVQPRRSQFGAASLPPVKVFARLAFGSVESRDRRGGRRYGQARLDGAGSRAAKDGVG